MNLRQWFCGACISTRHVELSEVNKVLRCLLVPSQHLLDVLCGLYSGLEGRLELCSFPGP
jgi:hypothetical protein